MTPPSFFLEIFGKFYESSERIYVESSHLVSSFPLKSKKISFDKVYSSSSVRTEITCSVGLEGIHDFKKVTFLDDLYHASAEHLEDFLQRNLSEESILVVGHNPGLSDVVSHLTHRDIYLRTCDLISLESKENDSKLLCNLCWSWSPKKGFIEN